MYRYKSRCFSQYVTTFLLSHTGQLWEPNETSTSLPYLLITLSIYLLQSRPLRILAPRGVSKLCKVWLISSADCKAWYWGIYTNISDGASESGADQKSNCNPSMTIDSSDSAISRVAGRSVLVKDVWLKLLPKPAVTKPLAFRGRVPPNINLLCADIGIPARTFSVWELLK